MRVICSAETESNDFYNFCSSFRDLITGAMQLHRLKLSFTFWRSVAMSNGAPARCRNSSFAMESICANEQMEHRTACVQGRCLQKASEAESTLKGIGGGRTSPASIKCTIASSKLGPKLDSVQGCCELHSCGKRIITLQNDTAQCKKQGRQGCSSAWASGP